MNFETNHSKDFKSLDTESLELETKIVLSLFRSGVTGLEMKDPILQFLETQNSRISYYMKHNEFKACVVVGRKIEAVLGQGLMNLSTDLEVIYLPLKDVLMNAVDSDRQYTPPDKVLILRHPVTFQETSIQNKALQGNIFRELSKSLDFFKLLLKLMICTLNNLGVASAFRGKYHDAQGFFSRALITRLYDMDGCLAFYQAIILELNLTFVHKELNEIEDAASIINKSIVVMEKLEGFYRLERNSYDKELFVTRSQQMLIWDIIFEKKGIMLFPPPHESCQEKIFYLLSVGYYYYGQLLQQLNKNAESQFCQLQQQNMKKIYFKVNKQAQQAFEDYNTAQKALEEQIQRVQEDQMKKQLELEKQREKYERIQQKQKQKEIRISQISDPAQNQSAQFPDQFQQSQTFQANSAVGNDQQRQGNALRQQSDQSLRLSDVRQQGKITISNNIDKKSENFNLVQEKNFYQNNQSQSQQSRVEQEDLDIEDEEEEVPYKDEPPSDPMDVVFNSNPIIYYSQLLIDGKQFKIVFTKLPQYNCVKMMVYSVEIKFKKEVLIDFQYMLQDVAKNQPDAFANESNKESYYKGLTKMVQVKDGQLNMGNYQCYQSLQEFQKSLQAKRAQTNFFLL